MHNFKEFTELPLAGRNQVFAQLLNTFFCDVTEKFGENEREGTEIDTYFSLGLDSEGCEWYLIYPDFLVCVGKNLGGKKFDQVFDEVEGSGEVLRDWMVENSFLTYVSNSVGLPIDIEQNFQKAREDYFYMGNENVTFQKLESEDDAPVELQYLQFCKNTFPIENLVKMVQKSNYKTVIDSIIEEDGQLLIDELFSVNFQVKKEVTEETAEDEQDNDESYSGSSVNSDSDDFVEIKPNEEERKYQSQLKKYRQEQMPLIKEKFIEFSKSYTLDEDLIKKSLLRNSFLTEADLSLLVCSNPNFIQFLPFITQKSLQKHHIDKSLPVSIIHLNNNHNYLNNLINNLQFTAIHITLNTLKNNFPLNIFHQNKALLSAKNYHNYKELFVTFLDEIFAIVQGLSQFYYDYTIANRANLHDIIDPSQNFIDDISSEGKFGQFTIQQIVNNENSINLKVFHKPRELQRMARVFTEILNKMPSFLQNKQFIPKSAELSQLRIFLGYEAPPRVKTPVVSSESSESSVDQKQIKIAQKRGYDFSDSEVHESYSLSSTSDPSQYSEPSSSSQSEYVQFTIFPDGTKSEISYVKQPFEIEILEEERDFTKPFLIRKRKQEYEKEERKKERERRAQIKAASIKLNKTSNSKKTIQVNQYDVGKYGKLKEIQERQRQEMEKYKARINHSGGVKSQFNAEVKKQFVPDIIERSTHPNINLTIPKLKENLNFTIPDVQKTDLKFDFNFDFK